MILDEILNGNMSILKEISPGISLDGMMLKLITSLKATFPNIGAKGFNIGIRGYYNLVHNTGGENIISFVIDRAY